MRNEDLLSELDRRLGDQQKIIEAKLTHVSAVIQAGFEMASHERSEIIKRQDITNGRVNCLENDASENKQFRNLFPYKIVGVIAISVILAVVVHQFGLLELLNIIK